MSTPYQELIRQLAADGVLRTPALIKAFHAIERDSFLLPQDRDEAGIDAPLPIGYDATNSQPTTVAIMLELIQPKAGDRALDVGSGSGWTAALLGSCVGKQGTVIGIELVPELVAFANANIKRCGLKNVVVIEGNGHEGAPDRAPFDIIHVAAAAASIPPKLLSQLAEGGRMVVPVGEPVQDLVFLTKHHSRISEQRLSGFQFVPLVK